MQAASRFCGVVLVVAIGSLGVGARGAWSNAGSRATQARTPGNASQSSAKPLAAVETKFPGLIAQLESLHRVGGAVVVRFAVFNSRSEEGFNNADVLPVQFARATIVDLKQNKKYQPMTVGGWVLAGPGTRGATEERRSAPGGSSRSRRGARAGAAEEPASGNTLMFGGPFGQRLQPGERRRMWIVFPAPPADAGDLTIDLPTLATFTNVPASTITNVEKPAGAPITEPWGMPGVSVTLAEATRSGDQVTVRLVIKNEATADTPAAPSSRSTSGRAGSRTRPANSRARTTGPSFPHDNAIFQQVFLRYEDAVLLDLQNQKLYGPVKDPSGAVVARPMNQPRQTRHQFGGLYSVNSDNYIRAGNQTTVSVAFQAPPAGVNSVFLYLPDMPPLFESIAMAGEGIALSGGGRSFSGQVKDLESALKNLNATVTQNEIQISLSSDVLFDFDKADIRPDAAAALKNVAVVINANPGGAVRIEGHTDSVGAEAYNLRLSERRAESVKAWLAAQEGITAARVVTRGFGKSRPIASNDTPEGRQKNRRVEIVVARTAGR